MMLTLSEKTEPFVATSVAEILSHITALVPKGFFHFSVLRSPDGTAAFDLDVVEEIERIKWAAHGVGVKPRVKYFRIGKTGLLLSNEASFFGPNSRHGDIREAPLHFDGYRVACKETATGGVFDIRISISPDFLGMYTLSLTRMARKDSIETAMKDIRRLLEVCSPEIVVQVESIFQAVNRERKAAGLELVSRADVGLPEVLVLPLTGQPVELPSASERGSDCR